MQNDSYTVFRADFKSATRIWKFAFYVFHIAI